MARAALFLLIAAAAAAATSAATPPEDSIHAADPWFPQVGDNLTRIDWAHAVNNRTYLDAVLAGDVMMIEADIVLGHEVGHEREPPQPVMAHPPATLSDLTLAGFVSSVKRHNAGRPRSRRKGVKLDFKSIEALEAAEKLVAPIAGDDIEYAVWLNADIVAGPVHAASEPVDAQRFLRVARSCPRATLSVGWTTRFGGDTGVTRGAYTQQHTAAMLDALCSHELTQPVTFPVRAGLAAASARALGALLADTRARGRRATLTVWSAAGDPVDAAALRALILDAGLDSVYLDVPAELAARIHLPAALLPQQ